MASFDVAVVSGPSTVLIPDLVLHTCDLSTVSNREDFSLNSYFWSLYREIIFFYQISE